MLHFMLNMLYIMSLINIPSLDVQKLQQDLDSKKKEAERVESVCNGLKTQVESLREELKATQKAFRDKMDLSLAKLDGEWTEKMEKLKADHTVNILTSVLS